MITKEFESRTFTREEFYEFVWSEPATRLSKELGCSDVMIGKVCKAYDIPKPYPGYWAQLANHKKPKRTPLPSNSDPDLQSLSFHKHPDFQATVNQPPRELQYDEDIIAALEDAKHLGPVKVNSTLRNPHHLVSVTKEWIEKEIAESKIPWSERNFSARDARPLTLAVDVSDGQLKRALRIMDAFIKRIEAIGGGVEIRKSGYNDRVTSTVVIITEEVVTGIRLREKHNQLRIKNETAKYSWERNRTELVPSGLLLFDSGPSSYGSPLLKDGKKSQIENKLGDLVVDLVKRAGELRIRRRQQEESARQRAEKARIQREREEELNRRREALESRQAEEQAKLDELLHHADSWRKSRMIRNYLDALCEACTNNGDEVQPDSPLAEYLRWGFEQADRMDPLRDSPHSVLDESIDDSHLESSPGKPR